MGRGVTAWDCNNKFKNMTATFKKIKKRTRESGGGPPPSWPYYEKMEELTQFDVAVNPKNILQCGAAGVSSFNDDRDDEVLFTILQKFATERSL